MNTTTMVCLIHIKNSRIVWWVYSAPQQRQQQQQQYYNNIPRQKVCFLFAQKYCVICVRRAGLHKWCAGLQKWRAGLQKMTRQAIPHKNYLNKGNTGALFEWSAQNIIYLKTIVLYYSHKPHKNREWESNFTLESTHKERIVATLHKVW